MHKLELSVLQQKVYDFIKSFTLQHGYPPTRHEIRAQFGFKYINSVTAPLNVLVKKKAIKIKRYQARGIKCLL